MATTTLIKEYDTKVDTKRRVTIRGTDYQFYHVREYNDGRIEFSPRILVDPITLSKNTLKAMDQAVKNLKENKVSEPINISKYLK